MTVRAGLSLSRRGDGCPPSTRSEATRSHLIVASYPQFQLSQALSFSGGLRATLAELKRFADVGESDIMELLR